MRAHAACMTVSWYGTHLMTFEPILITALLLAQLTVPTELRQALGFDTVADLGRTQGLGEWVDFERERAGSHRLGRHEVILPHLGDDKNRLECAKVRAESANLG